MTRRVVGSGRAPSTLTVRREQGSGSGDTRRATSPRACVVEAMEPRTLFATVLPPGFQMQKVASIPSTVVGTSMTFTPDGRLFYTELKPNKVVVIKNGVKLATPLISLPSTTTNKVGIECIVLDPKFSTNGYFYLYTATEPGDGSAICKVTRYTIDPNNKDRALPNSGVVLLDNMKSDKNIHNGGAMHFGADGMLYVSTGEGSDWSQSTTKGYSQDLSKLTGKVLRINPANYPGSIIPSDNPFVGQAGKRPEIWAYGIRNAFSGAMRPGTSTLWLNDVGSNKFEEVNEIQKGKNYGWPLVEGNSSNAAYTNPAYVYPYALPGKAVTGGVFYTGDNFPSSYKGKYFFSDYVEKFIRVLNPDTKQVTTFGTDVKGFLDFDVAPDGSLWGIAAEADAGIWRISYAGTGQNRAPLAVAKVDATAGPLTKAFQFDGSASTDPDADTLTYNWTFGDGTTGTGAKPTHTYATAGRYEVKLTVTDGRGGSSTADTLVVHPGDQPPVVDLAVALPSDASLYTGGNVLQYSATATDPEDGPLAGSAFKWQVVFHHQTHTHPFADELPAATSGQVTLPAGGEFDPVQWYRVRLTVTDKEGASTTVTKDVHPETGSFTVNTNVAGLQLTLDNQPQPAGPVNVTGVVGHQRLLTAPSVQTLAGKTYRFSGWSDGGASTHVVTTAAQPATYTANYTVDPTPATRSVKAVADAHVRGGTYAAQRYGTAGKLELKRDASASYNREIYLTFNISSISATAPGLIKLRLNGSVEGAAASTGVSTMAYGLQLPTWGESTLTYNGRPTPGAAVSPSVTVRGGSTGWYEWDVTNFIKSERAKNRNVAGLVIRATAASVPLLKFIAREGGALGPELMIG